jgi:hypothetical protein
MIPGKDIALATAFATYDEAARMADKIAADDPEWDYGVVRVTAGKFVIAVNNGDEDDFVFLGYL